MTDYRIADPVVDLAQARPMVVVATPEQTVSEWSDANGYDLMDNYANAKFDPDPTEGVVETVYVSDLRSEPSKTYTFPESRVALIDVHHADGGRRLYDRVAVDVLWQLFDALDDAQYQSNRDPPSRMDIADLARIAFASEDIIDEARELADVERRFGEGEE